MLLVIEQDRATLRDAARAKGIYSFISSIEGRRRWIKEDLIFEPTGYNIELVTAAFHVVTSDLRDNGANKTQSIELAPYCSKTTPFPHQEKARDWLNDKNFWALFMEQGTGKTKVLLDRAGELYSKGVITGLIVVSKKGVHSQWCRDEAPIHLGVKFHSTIWPAKEFSSGDGLAILSINYDGLKSKKGIEFASRFAKLHKNKLFIIADESQEIKNARSQRWRAMQEIAPFSTYRALATGTPIAKDLTDEWSQLKWLDESIIGIKYATTFRSTYCVMGGFQNKQVIGHKRINEFKSLTAPYVFRATKDEIGILPKVYKTWTFDLTKEQMEAILGIKKKFETTLENGEIITAANGAAVLGKIQQISSGFAMNDDGSHDVLHFKKNPRVQTLIDWIEAEPEEKAIVWCKYQKEFRIIAEALEYSNIHFVEYHGLISDKDRKTAVQMFLDEDLLGKTGTRIFLANAQSAGVGLNLQGRCRRACYFSNSFSAIDRWQSEDRIHRIGSKGNVEYTDLIATRSIDRRILDNLKRKKSLSDLVLGEIKEIMSDIG